jgi:hypothetical protein
MMLRKVFLLFFVIAVTLAGCGTSTEPAAETSVSTVESPTESSQSPEISDDADLKELSAHYLKLVCDTNVFSDVRSASYLLALQDKIDVGALAEFAPEDAAIFRNSAKTLLAPPEPWPSDLEPLISQRAESLNEVSDLLEGLANATQPAEVIDFFDRLTANRSAVGGVADQIRGQLGITSNSSCPDVVNETADSVLAQLESQRSAIVALECSGASGSDDRLFEGLANYWSATEEGWRASSCEVDIQEFNPEGLSEFELDAISLISKSKKQEGTDFQAPYEILVEFCVNEFEGGFGDMKSSQAVLIFCPRHPQREVIKDWAEGRIIEDDGDYDIGVEISAGIWKSDSKVNECYWERTSPQGAILANNFITNSSQPISVTVNSSDGSFSTEGCGSWQRVK